MSRVGANRRTPPIRRILVRMTHFSPRKSVAFTMIYLLLFSKIGKDLPLNSWREERFLLVNTDTV